MLVILLSTTVLELYCANGVSHYCASGLSHYCASGLSHRVLLC